MKEAVEAIAERLVDAAYERFGRPPDPGGVYIEEVTREKDVKAYFRGLVRLAEEARAGDLWSRYEAYYDADAAMVTDAGLRQIAGKSGLPEEQRQIIEDIRAFEAWTDEVEAAWIEQINRESMQ